MADLKQLHILQHSLGVDQYGRGAQYRNHFVTGEDSTDHPDCMALVAAGLMQRHAGSVLTGGADCFTVTEAGIAHVEQHSPEPPKLTRSQQRYAHYRNVADCYENFAHFLKCQGRKHA